MIRSIRFSLTLWYVGILTVILCLFGGILYRMVSFNIRHDIDRLLMIQSDGIGDAIFSFWKAEENEGFSKKERTRKSFRKEVEIGNFAALVDRWARATDELRTVRPIRLLDREGRTVGFSPSLAKWNIPVTPRVLAKVKAGHTIYQTFKLPTHRVRFITHPEIEDGKLLYIVQVASSLHIADGSLFRLRLWLMLLIPATALFTSLIGWILASIALRPVGKMITQAELIRESRLHERIDAPHTQDELERLAKAFNEMLDRLERSFKRMRQFSAAASHELRTPLTIMKGEIEWVLRKPRMEGEYERVLKTQLDVINELSGIVDQLLAVAHAGESELTLEWKQVDLIPIVKSVEEMYRPMAVQKKVAVRIQGARSVLARGERALLERLVSNLLENALKHTPSGGGVVIDVAVLNSQAVITVQDTGRGIDPAELPRVFEKFFIRKSSAEGVQSTGIGLGLCRWIAEVHQGRIEAASAPDQGSVFTVYLPLFNPID